MSFIWSEAAMQRLARYWQEGLTASRIAERFGGGVTRSAILGKVHREGLAERKPTPAVAAIPKAKSAPKAVQKAARAPALVGDDGIELVIPVRADAFQPLPGAVPVSLEALTYDHCRWPIDGEDDHVLGYCALKAEPTAVQRIFGRPARYCPTHSEMSRSGAAR